MIRVNNKKLYKDSKCMALWKIQNFGDCQKIRGCQGLGGGRDE